MDDSEKTKLTPANDNPCYWLATVYGEQTNGIDDALAKKNRIAWNRWIAAALSDEERVALINQDFNETELTPFSNDELNEHAVAVLKRSGRESIKLPGPLESADFHSNRFEQYCIFGGYLFWDSVRFESATFSLGADFRSATFNGFADFQSAIFNGEAHFDSSRFIGEARFEWATFSVYADFGSATFSLDANFRLATFGGDAHFGQANFREGSHFEWTTFNAYTDFGLARFYLDVDFINAKFLSATSFSKAAFLNEVPKLFGATLHEGTEWHGTKWPLPPASRSEVSDQKDKAQQQVYAYERLKQEMEKLKKHEDEQFFFRQELRARRELYSWRKTYWWLNLLYQGLSNYGYGVLRPLGWFGGLFLVGFALLALDPLGFAGKKLTAWDAAFTSFANMFGTLPLKTLANYTTDKTFAYSAEIFAIFQTIAGAVLLFLFFLALRNRFRLR